MVRLRPYGGFGQTTLLMLWECWHGAKDIKEIEKQGIPDFNSLDPLYPEICVRGLSTMIPEFEQYVFEKKKHFYKIAFKFYFIFYIQA